MMNEALQADAAEVRPRRILLVDDHPIVRDGLAQIIGAQPDLEVCGQAESAERAIAMIASDPPDLAVVDIFMEGMSGIDLTKALQEREPDLPVLVLSMHDEAVYAERALRAGARGYVMKQVASRTILEAIRTVLDGRVFVSPRIAAMLPDLTSLPARGSELSPDAGVERLSERELEIFELIGQGVNRSGIADRLNISTKTVETHRANMKYKLRIRTAAELQQRARRWVLHHK